MDGKIYGNVFRILVSGSLGPGTLLVLMMAKKNKIGGLEVRKNLIIF